MTERHSQAEEPQLVSDPDEIARIESENSLRQFDAAMLLFEDWRKDPHFKLRPSLVLRIHRVLMDRLSEYAGTTRPASVAIGGSRHQPPPAGDVPQLIEELCDYVNENWRTRSAVNLAAYVLWRMNWIHPFSDGNGRTARITSYLVLCAHARNRLPGKLTIPEQISRNKQPYYEALEVADRAAEAGHVDVSALENLLASHLANQLYDFYKEIAGQADSGLNEASRAELRKVLADASIDLNRDAERCVRQRISILGWIERHPALMTLIAALLATALAILFAR
jgi:fido (protein-threonine AMPylation protein)